MVALVERGGRVRSHHVQEVTAKTLGPILAAQLDGASCVYTDEAGAMKKAAGEFGRHAASANMFAATCTLTPSKAISRS